MKIRYAEGTETLDVRKIATWDRGDIAGPVMSASSGPKGYVKNGIWSVFEKNPEVNRIVMVRGKGDPFLLTRDDDDCWFDMSGKQVTNV